MNLPGRSKYKIYNITISWQYHEYKRLWGWMVTIWNEPSDLPRILRYTVRDMLRYKQLLSKGNIQKYYPVVNNLYFCKHGTLILKKILFSLRRQTQSNKPLTPPPLNKQNYPIGGGGYFSGDAHVRCFSCRVPILTYVPRVCIYFSVHNMFLWKPHFLKEWSKSNPLTDFEKIWIQKFRISIFRFLASFIFR